MRIAWDEPKRLSTLAHRGMDFATLDPEFFAGAVTTPARDGRYQAIGAFRGTLVTVIFTTLGSEAISVVSMRRASRKERNAHEAKDIG